MSLNNGDDPTLRKNINDDLIHYICRYYIFENETSGFRLSLCPSSVTQLNHLQNF